MKSKKYLFSLFFACCIFSACKKDKPLDYSTTPELSFISISPSSVKEFKDSITIVISYTDGDGDLGENNSNIENLFVTDKRINITYPFRIQQLSPDNSGITIKGKLNIILKNTGITDGSTQQPVSYEVYMVDRAGHQSNTISTTSITVNQ